VKDYKDVSGQVLESSPSGSRMAYQGLRANHCLEGASNFVPWKGRITIVLEDNGVGEFIKQAIALPQDPQQ